MSRSQPKSSFLRTLFLTIFVFACVGVLVILALIEYLPGTAAESFGPADRRLGIVERTLYSARVLAQRDELLIPVSKGAAEPQSFQIENGESVNLIALHLENAGLIHDAGAFRYYLIYSGSDTNLQSGKFSLSSSMSAVEIAKTIQDANATEITFRILPGWRLEDIGAGLAVSGLAILPQEFIDAATQPESGVIPPLLKKMNLKSLEGFLLPGTYRFKRSSREDDVIMAASAAFENQMSDELLQGFSRQGLDLYEAVTLASIVQRESVVEEEQPLIASVFFNRLQKGMRLESDPTVQYALGYNTVQKTWWTNPLSLENLKVKSPYNTYVNSGLPPGPIDSPGLPALRAVAFPAQTPYFYFRAQCNTSGKHNFSTTFAEHLNKACP